MKTPIQKARAHGLELAIGASAVVLFFVLWEVITQSVRMPYFPPPSVIFENAVSKWFGGPWYSLFLTETGAQQLLPSVGRMLVGWGIAVVLGVVLGFVVGLYPRIAAFFYPAIEFMRNLPPAALLPIFLLILGVGDGMKVAFIALTVVWPILLNTIDGVGSVEQTQLDSARAYNIRWTRVLRSIILPSALPKIFAGLRVSLSLALILMVVSEMMAATNGIGFEILLGQRTFRIVDMWSGIVVLSALGVLLNIAIQALESRSLRWHRGARA